MRRFSTATAYLFFGVIFGAALHAQVTVTVEDKDVYRELRRAGDTLIFDSEGMRQAVEERLVVSYESENEHQYAEIEEPTIVGSSRFSVLSVQPFPVRLDPGETLVIRVRFVPTGVGPFTGQLRLPITAQVNPRSIRRTDNSFLVNLSGRVADYNLSFQLPGGNQTVVDDGGTVLFEDTNVDTTMTATVIATNRGSGPGMLETVSIDGGEVFELSGLGLLPTTIQPERDLRFQVIFTPNAAQIFSGSIALGFSSGTSTLQLAGEGVAAEYSYELTTSDGRTASVPENGTISFGSAPVGEEVVSSLTVTNIGTVEGAINNITITGDGYGLSDRPLLPTLLDAGESFTIKINLTAPEPGPANGQLRIGDSTFKLTGEGVAAEYSYELTTSDGRTASVPENGTISFGSAPVGEEVVSSLTVTNIGTVEGAINNITITGDGYGLSDRPLLPTLLDAGESFTIKINLTAPEPGPANGQLRIGDSTFKLTGEGLGGILTYTLIGDDGSRQIEPRDTIVFPQTQIGGASELTLQISNAGNESETLSSIAVGAGAFSLSDLPALPASLSVDRTIAFTIVFEPDRLGTQNAALTINAATFTFSGVGAEAPDLPAVSFSTSGGTVLPADSIPIGLSIAEVFPIDIEGAMNLTFDTAAFSNDPTIQFSTGGRNAPFRIPQGQTDAIFSGDLATNHFLTGTVAGTITVSATFATEKGKVDITPDTVPELTFTVNKATPSLQSLTLGSTGQGRFGVLVTGFATSRTVSQLQIAFAGVTGSNITTPSLTTEVSNQFTLYYGGSQSSNFGSLFTATINFTVNEGEFEDLSTVTITAVNEIGQSNPLSLTLN